MANSASNQTPIIIDSANTRTGDINITIRINYTASIIKVGWLDTNIIALIWPSELFNIPYCMATTPASLPTLLRCPVLINVFLLVFKPTVSTAATLPLVLLNSPLLI